MPVISSVFLALALILGVVFGTQTEPWTWGPALLALGISTATALPSIWRQQTLSRNTPILVIGALTAAWFALRALTSPVAELAQADLLLLATVIGAFVSMQAISGQPAALKTLNAGIALLLLANLVVIAIQLAEPGYRPLLANLTDRQAPTGFFTHYNYAANYLLISGLWLLADAWMSRRQQGLLSGLQGLLGAAGLAAVWFTQSRGGFLAAIIGLGTLVALILMNGHRRKSSWFPLAMVVVPLVGLALMGALYLGWQQLQQGRTGVGSISALMDNRARLSFLGVAFSSIASHLFTGGGSRSFSWECFQFWDQDDQGWWLSKPEFVHNEWLQAATDYGLIGLLLLIVFISTLGISSIMRILLGERSGRHSAQQDALQMGGLAALMGLLVQSCFSFIIHLIPGAILLGLCLAASLGTAPGASRRSTLSQKILTTTAAAAALLLMLPGGWRGSRVLHALWPSHYSKQRSANAERQIESLSVAISIWPQAALHFKRGLLHHQLATADKPEASLAHAEAAVEDYASASRLHRHFPEAEINRANALSKLQRPQQAQQAYERAIELQGEMYYATQAHYHYAGHLHAIGMRQLSAGDHQQALAILTKAADHIDQAFIRGEEGRAVQISIHEALGIAREINGLNDLALASYEKAATLHGKKGRGIHFRSAVLLAAEANRVWHQRQPGKALSLFLKARQCIKNTSGKLPQDFTAKQRGRFVKQLNNTIQLLQDANIEPVE